VRNVHHVPVATNLAAADLIIAGLRTCSGAEGAVGLAMSEGAVVHAGPTV
jgi:methylglyoxal synthase